MKRSEAFALRRAMDTAATSLPDEVALEAVELYPEWSGRSVLYVVDFRVQYDGKLYKCTQEHTSQSTWTPTDAPSLWAIVHVGVSEWVQPTGASDAYNKGDKVTHNGKTWTSDVDANVWEPGVYGWTADE